VQLYLYLTHTVYICFSGYDFGYLLKLLTDQNLPQEESDFFELLRIYFPTVYDVKVSHLVSETQSCTRKCCVFLI
jgi:hypothetical protein